MNSINYAIESMEEEFTRVYSIENLSSLQEKLVNSINENIELLDLLVDGWMDNSSWRLWSGTRHAKIHLDTRGISVFGADLNTEESVSLMESLRKAEEVITSVLENEGF